MVEYIYLLGKVWKLGGLRSYPIKFGFIITNVIKLENSSFEFIHKESGEKFITSYSWAIAENTPENLEKIDRYLESKNKLEELKQITEKLRNEIIYIDSQKII